MQTFRPNTACTGHWGVCRIFKHFSGFEFFLLPNIVHARLLSTSTNRWALVVTILESKES